MNKEYKIIWSKISIQKLKEIVDFIATDKPIAAKNFSNDIFEQTDKLMYFPEIGRKVPEINRTDIREIIFKNYRIIYKIDKDIIFILTIRNSRQILKL